MLIFFNLISFPAIIELLAKLPLFLKNMSVPSILLKTFIWLLIIFPHISHVFQIRHGIQNLGGQSDEQTYTCIYTCVLSLAHASVVLIAIYGLGSWNRLGPPVHVWNFYNKISRYNMVILPYLSILIELYNLLI